MRTREKIIFLLVGATLILGGLIFFAFQGNETEANYLRWQLAEKMSRGFSSPGGFMADELPSGTLLYGGLALFAIVMTIIVLKMVRDGELQALRQHLRDLRQQKYETESALQEQVWKGKTDRQAKDSVMRDLESSIDKIEALLSELSEKEKELKTRDAELMTLKNSAVEEAVAAYTPGADRQLREELKRRNEMLQAKDAALREMEQRFAAKTRLAENQLREKDGLLKQREGELATMRLEQAELGGRVEQLDNARKRTEERLEQELRQKREILEAEALARQAEEHRLNEAVRALEAQMGERDRILRQRDAELGNVRRQITDLESGKAELERQISEISASAEKERHERESGLHALEQRTTARVHELQEEIGKRDLLLQSRDDEVQSLHSELKTVTARLHEMTSAKARGEEVLQVELNQSRQQYEAEALELRQREERHHTEVNSLRAHLGEQEEFLKRRDQDVQALEQRLHNLQRKLDQTSAARQQSEKTLREALAQSQRDKQASELAVRDWEQRYREVEKRNTEFGEQQEARRRREEENKQLKAQVASLAQQLAKIGSAKEQAAQLLQQSLKKEKAVLQASDSAVREIEENYKEKIAALEGQIAERQDLVGSQEAELGSLKAELAAASQKMSDLAAAKQRADELLEQAIRQQSESLEARDVSVKQIETDLGARLWDVESRLRENEELLHRRESEIHGLKNQLDELESAKESAASALREELRQRNEALRAKEAATGLLEERLQTAVRDMESELQAKQELLAAREAEIKSLFAKLNSQSEQLVDIESSKENAARTLEQELRRASELAEVKETALKALEERLTSRVQTLEKQLDEKQDLLGRRDSEVDALMAKIGELSQNLAEIGAERQRSERMFQEDLREKTALLQSNQASIGELEKSFNGRIESLQRQVVEKQKLLEASGGEMAELRAQLNAQAESLDEAEGARVRLEALLQQERSKSDKALMVMPALDQNGDAQSDGQDRGMDLLLSEREELLKARDHLIQNLMSELKEKKTQLARQEIEVWKGIERREAWKHRLAKVGIRLKD